MKGVGVTREYFGERWVLDALNPITLSACASAFYIYKCNLCNINIWTVRQALNAPNW